MPSPIPDLPTLEGATLRVRPWTLDDVNTIIAASHDPFIPEITTVPANADEHEARAFVERQIDRPHTDYGHARAIAMLDDNRPVGHLYTSLARHGVGRAEMGYWVLADHRGRGIAAQALELAAAWVLQHLPINRITLYIEPWNEGSVRTAERAGFTSEGLLRSWDTYADGEPRDMLVFGRINESSP